MLAVASPSAIKAWVKLAGLQDQTDIAIACIGEDQFQGLQATTTCQASLGAHRYKNNAGTVCPC